MIMRFAGVIRYISINQFNYVQQVNSWIVWVFFIRTLGYLEYNIYLIKGILSANDMAA